MESIRLSGDWRLSYWDEQTPGEVKSLPAVVPGNVELDLMREGALPDVFFGENIRLLRKYEFCAWKYERAFDAPRLKKGQRAYLRFEGVDCIAEYALDGAAFAHSQNALVEHRFDVTSLLTPGAHKLAVTLSSPILYAARLNYDAMDSALRVNYESLRVRKAPSQYGWDIMPRAVSAGLWRDVYLDVEEPTEINDVYLATLGFEGEDAKILCVVDAHTDAKHFDNLRVRVEMGDYAREFATLFPKGRFTFTLPKAEKWWPRGYGAQRLYAVRVSLLVGGEVAAAKEIAFGVRTVALERSEITDAKGGEFRFLVNGVPVFLKGSNWVPADAFHSRDPERYARMLALFEDTNCSVLRCWGGNVYEDHAFFDICDRLGILVWQDFAMACGNYPRDDGFLNELREEAEKVVRKLRNHASLLLWSGDNECDACCAQWGAKTDPATNRATRETLPRVTHRLDPYRPFLPSSPYISPEAWALGGDERLLPEAHLWGPRDFFKSAYYTTSSAHFVSETGYHGCNNISSMRTFLPEDKLWPWQGNGAWLAHAFEPLGPEGPYAYRIKLMADQIKELFGRDADNLEDFILASQISQAEAKKFFIELTRAKKWRRTGVIWWNMIDGWPQFSDAVVSYDFGKKLAYHYIKRSQRDLCLMLTEPEAWHVRLVAANDTLCAKSGACRVWDGETGETIYEGAFTASANDTTEITKIRVSHGEHRLYLISWDAGADSGVNHYALGKPPFDLARYRSWLTKIAALDGAFAASEVGQ